MMTETFKRKLTILSQEELTTFEHNGKPSVLYKVEAVTEAGERVTKKLRTFHADLPIGELIEFEVSPYEHEEYGLTYTLKMPSKGRASKKDIADLQTQVTNLANRVGALESEVGELRDALLKQRPREPEL